MDEVDDGKKRERFYRKVDLDNQEAKAAEADAEKPLMIGGKPHCCDCGRPIGKKRLKARPKAARCIDCKGNWERSRG